MITLTIAQLKILQGKSGVRMFTLRLVSGIFCWVRTGLRREGIWVFQRVAADISQGRLARSATSKLLTILNKIPLLLPLLSSPPHYFGAEKLLCQRSVEHKYKEK